MTGSLATYSDSLTPTATAYKGEIQTQAVPADYSTSFPATESPISESSNWTNGLAVGLDWNNVQTTPGKAFGAAISGAQGGNGGDGFTGAHGLAGSGLETFVGGARGLGDLGNKAGGGGGGSSTFGTGGAGGNYGGAAATSPGVDNYGAGGGGGAALAAGANGSGGVCIVEWIS